MASESIQEIMSETVQEVLSRLESEENDLLEQLADVQARKREFRAYLGI